MLRISNIKFPVTTDFSDITALLQGYLKRDDISEVTLIRKSVDARKKEDIHFVCTFDFSCKNEEKLQKKNKNIQFINKKKIGFEIDCNAKEKGSPVIIGSGPAGLFCALTLVKNGFSPIIVERGEMIDERVKSVNNFTRNGKLNTQSNIQFGEGGAGTFSDGKLNTGIKDSYIRLVLETFAEHGAEKDILYSAKPHIGTDRLREVIKSIRKEIISLGGRFLFSTTLTDINIADGKIKSVILESQGEKSEIECDRLILAIGHSARDTFLMLKEKGAEMERKPFAVGVRIEHPQELINKIQYGDPELSKYLGAADYKLAVHLENGRSLYTFCMCPGGYVVAAASEKGRVCVNGMSEQRRDNFNANSALLVGINPSDFDGEDVLAGIAFQRELEEKAFVAGGKNYFAPVMTVEDFINNRPTASLSDVKPTYTPGVTPCDFADIFPTFITDTLKSGLWEMDKKMHGFLYPSAVLTAVESRSSSPVRICRDASRQSVNIKGLYPCGEGSGYAGGITSAAVDGIRTAVALIENQD